MRITFKPTENQEIGNQNHVSKKEVKVTQRAYQGGAVFGQNQENSWFGGTKEKAKSYAELQQELGNTDVGIMQDYKTLLSNTMSEEDYAKLEKEGFDFSNIDPEMAVTIVDKIKAELVRSGQHIVGYTDDLDIETLAAALGSNTLASAVSESFRQADIPLTEENLQAVKIAWDMAGQLNTPTEGAYRYMVDNGMEAEIWNYYLSQSSGAAVGAGQGTAFAGHPRFYAEDIEGYYAESAKGNPVEDLQGQIGKLLEREVLEVNEENYWTAEKLLEGGLPITKENIMLMQELRGVEFPVTETVFAGAAAAAIAEGREPIHGNLAKHINIYEQAAELMDYFQGENAMASRRQLEEIRLRMSAEVNVKLLKSGFSIDTAPMEELIEALRKAEAEVAAQYFPEDAEAVSKYQLYCSTREAVNELPGMPARILGSWSREIHQGTLEEFHTEGKALQESYAKAQEEYETLMTAPRKDLGDSIRKAFANVDDILKDLGLETSEANRRVIRILGYNQMEIDAANIQRVQEADAVVQNVVNKMTPASTLKMIRDGKNPLEMSFTELENYFDSLSEEYEDSAENYSRFLYGLERNNQITEEERSAYIGIYRMLHQINASDGAVVGTLVNVGAELHFANLMSAVRSSKFQTMDVSVSDNFGVVAERSSKGESITEQIAKGFVETAKELLTDVSYAKDVEQEYDREQLELLRQVVNVDDESVEMLMRVQLPRSAENLLAAKALTDNSCNPFREWNIKKMRMSENMLIPDSQAVEDFDLAGSLEEKEVFREKYEGLLSGLERAAREISLEQAKTSVDVRGMKLLHKQFAVAGSLARGEEYVFPMYVGGELTKVHLTLNSGEGAKGTVSVAVDLFDGEHLEAHFQAENGKISGYLEGNTDSAVTKLERAADKFNDAVLNSTRNNWTVETLPIVNRQESMISNRRQMSVNREVPGEEAYKDVDNSELYRIAKVFLEAVQAA